MRPIKKQVKEMQFSLLGFGQIKKPSVANIKVSGYYDVCVRAYYGCPGACNVDNFEEDCTRGPNAMSNCLYEDAKSLALIKMGWEL